MAAVNATRSTSLFNDVNGDGKADPGDTLLTHIIVNNPTASAITNVTVADTTNGTSVVAGSVLVTVSDSYSLVGNTPISFTAAGGLLSNDFNGDGANQGNNTGLTVTGATESDGHGSVTANADGSFTFTPTTGYTGDATFTYNVTDSAGTVGTATATMHIAGLVWYVDGNAATNGDGSYNNPFNNLASLSGHTAANDSIVAHGSLTGSLTLQNGESLYGDGSSFLVNGHQVTNSGTHSNISYSGTGITLASGNTIDGVDLTGTANTARGLYDNGATVGNLTINHMAVSGQGQIADISNGGTLNVTLDSASSTAIAANATTSISTDIYLGGTFATALTGTFTVNGATTIGGGSNYGIATTGFAAGLTADFKGATSVSGAFSHDAVSLAGTGTTTFDGGLTLNQTAGSAAFATTGGTVAVYGGASSITTTTDGAVNMNSTAIDATHNVTFNSITTGTVASASAIALSNVTGGSFNGGTTIIGGATGADAIKISGGSMSAAANFGSTTISGTTGATSAGIEVNGTGTGAVSFSSVAIDGTGGDGVLVTGSSHAVTISGGSIGATTSPTGDDLHITGGIGAVTVAASLTKTTAGAVVDVDTHSTGTVAVSGNISATGAVANGIVLSNNTGGAINFTGSSVVLTTGANNALDFNNTNSTGAAVTFNGGHLNVTTTSGTGINATSTTTGVSSLTISGANNTVDTTGGGTGVKVDGVNEAITLLHANVSGGSNDGIYLQNAGSGGFTITGSSTTAASGGTIGLSSGGADGSTTQGIGIYLHNVGNVSLSDMNFTGNDSNFGIRGDTVNNFTLNDSNLTGNFGTTAGAAAEGAISFGTQSGTTNGLTGTALFSGDAISGGFMDNVDIYNNAPGSLNVTFQDSGAHQETIGDSVGGVNDGVHIETAGGTAGSKGSGASLTATINGVDFTGAKGDLLQIAADNSTTQNITIEASHFSNNDPNIVSGGGGVTLNGGGNTSNYVINYNITGNTFKGAMGDALLAQYDGQSADVSGIIQNNTIGTPNGTFDATAANDGSSNGGNGIEVGSEKFSGTGTLTHAVLISGNTVADVKSGLGGISLNSNNQGSGTEYLEATITGNTVKDQGANAFAALYTIVGGSAAGDVGTMGLNITNNTFNNSGATAGGGNAIDFDQVSTSAHYYFPGYGGSPNGEFASPAGTASANLGAFLTDGAHLNTLTNGHFPGFASGGVDATIIHGATGTSFTHAVPLMVVQQATPPDPTGGTTDPTGGTTGDPTGGTTGDPTGGTTDPTGGTTGDPTGGTVPTTPTTTPAQSGVLTQAALDTMVDAAIAHWAAAGATAGEIATMKATVVTISSIAGLDVGDATPGHIAIDADAGGYGWFIDSTPADNSEFTGTGTDLHAVAGGAADGKIDLLTVLMHEFGHQVGLIDDYQPADSADLMYGYVNPGERRLPSATDVAAASGTAVDHESFALAPVSVGTIVAGGEAEVSYQSTVNSFSPGLVPSFDNDATVNYKVGGVSQPAITSNHETLSITSTPALASLTLGDTVYVDANSNHTYDAGEGKSGVALTLYTLGTAGSPGSGPDANGDGIADTQVATATTGANGAYSFTGLAPGNYVVSIDASNFASGHALAGTIVLATAADPNTDTTDNDNNAVNGPSGTVVTETVTLAYGAEPTSNPATTDHDVNNTVDLGLVLNGPPTANNDSVTVNEDSGSNDLTSQLVSNDTDPDNDTLTITAATAATHGTVAVSSGTLTYTPNADYNGADSFTYTISDGHGHTATATASVTVDAVNDPVTANVPATYTINEDVVAPATGFSISDVDTTLAPNGIYQITLSASHGAVTFGTLANLTIDAGANDSGTVTLHGKLADINNALAGISYQANADYHGSDSITLSVTDTFGGTVATGSGAATSDSQSTAVTVNSVNDAPTTADNTVTTSEDTAYVFQTSDFAFSDPHDSPADSLQSVEIVSLPAAGSLTDNGVAVTAGEFVSAADIAAGKLVFTPAADANAAAYAAFQFAVQDDGGTANGGVDTSSAFTMTINVTAVNDPVGLTAPSSISGTEDKAYLLSSSGTTLSISDVDATLAPNGLYSVTLSADHGTLTMSTLAGLTFDTGDGTSDATMTFHGTLADINAALASASYQGDLNYNGTDTIHFSTTDQVGGTVATGSGAATSSGGDISVTLAPDGFIDADPTHNNPSGTPGNDDFRFAPGGTYTVDGLGGSDLFYFGGGGMTTADMVDGGPGVDQIALQGDYWTTPLVLGAGVVNVETMYLMAGSDTRGGDTAGNHYSYNITTDDANVGAGQEMLVDGSQLRAGEDFTFDGSAETNGFFYIYAGQGVDTLTGGAKNDVFLFNQGTLGASDHVDGGAGINQLALRGDYDVTFSATQMDNIDDIYLVSAHDRRLAGGGTDFTYNLTMDDGNVASGHQMTIDGSALHSLETLTFDGSAEMDGSFKVYGGAGDDSITGSHGDDMICGGLGADTLTGGAGNDTFLYRSVADSTPTSHDTINDFTSGDIIDLSQIDANTNVAGNQAFTFVGAGAFTHHAGELIAVDNGGGNWTVSADTNGDGVADLQIMVHVADAHTLTAADFHP